jgi:selenide,water dikinase
MKPFADAAPRIAAALATAPHVVIAGGGAAGVELAWALAARLRARGAGRVTLCDPAAMPLSGHAPATQQRALRALQDAGISWRGGAAVTAVQRDAVLLADGTSLAATLVINASGAAGAPLFGAAGLPVDARGFLRVGDDLRCPTQPTLFAAGDCAVLASYPDLPRAGVYAVRQGPLLAANLRAASTGAALRPFRARRTVLALLNTADGRAILSFGRFATHARAAWWLKDAIDRRFVARFA